MADPDPSDNVTALSDVLGQDLRVERADSRILHIKDDVRVRVPAARRPVLYAVLEGMVTIQCNDGPSVTLEAGENALIFYGDGHELGRGADLCKAAAAAADERTADTVQHLNLGRGKARAMVLQCVIELAYFSRSAFSVRAFPDLVAMRDQRPEAAHGTTVFAYDPTQLRSELDGPGGPALAAAFANLQLCHALKQHSCNLWGTFKRDVRSFSTRRIAAVIREMRAHPDRNWTLAELARHAGVSRSAFAAIFQEAVGEPPISFLTKERMQRAAKLLRNNSLSLHEVSRRVGYEIESSFARAFKRHWGVAPRYFAHQVTSRPPSDAALHPTQSAGRHSDA